MDEDRINELLIGWERYIAKQCWTVAGGYGFEVVSDVYQDACLRLSIFLRHYVSSGDITVGGQMPVDVYWKTVGYARDAAKKYRRSRDRQQRAEQKAAQLAEGGKMSWKDRLERLHDSMDYEWRMKLVQECWNTMTLKQQQVMDLHFRAGKDFHEISALLQIATNAVRNRIDRGIEMLRECIQQRTIENCDERETGETSRRT